MNDDSQSRSVSAAIATEVYSDAVAPAMREFAKIGVDAVKVLRLALFPLQYGAAMQDRLARRIEHSLEAVPPARRIAPPDSIMLPVAERLRYQEDGNPIADLYVNLLARAMDKERIGEAHPAFVHIIGQLAPDEVLFLTQLFDLRDHIYLREGQQSPGMLKQEGLVRLRQIYGESDFYESLASALVEPEALAQPELFSTFLSHLVTLGVVEYTNKPEQALEKINRSILGYEMHYIRLSQFGRLFCGACLNAS
ncbi:DUF4393 domain-containing protein [Aquabacterium sp. A3]|uniref:DUF4393 domain-containing protein n=1 Tax=Aquabacterium sp. A3 TaxID=3132829 RepID=UPI0031196E5C